LELEPGLKGFTVYRPKDLTQRATYPVVVWENGGCSLDGLLFAEFLRELVSNGIVIIVDGAPNGSGMGMLGVDGQTLMQGMDWAMQQNSDPCSKYYRKLEVMNIAAMGQSCGGLHAYAVSSDPRVSTVVIWNSGLLDPDQAILDKLHAPMAYFIGGMDDVSYPNADRDFKDIKQAIPIFYGNLNVGHLATYSQDNGGEFGRVGAAWLRWQLLHEDGPEGKGMFSGADCGLCKTEWVIEKKNMD
jgi:dienelactone hydrolase